RKDDLRPIRGKAPRSVASSTSRRSSGTEQPFRSAARTYTGTASANGSFALKFGVSGKFGVRPPNFPLTPNFSLLYEGRRNHRCGWFRAPHEGGSPQAATCLERHSDHYSYNSEIRYLACDRLHYRHGATRVRHRSE